MGSRRIIVSLSLFPFCCFFFTVVETDDPKPKEVELAAFLATGDDAVSSEELSEEEFWNLMEKFLGLEC